MTKFEQVGCNYQTSARSKEEAIHRFKTSCDICCFRGINILGGCDRCAIEATHKMTIAYFDEGSEK